MPPSSITARKLTRASRFNELRGVGRVASTYIGQLFGGNRNVSIADVVSKYKTPEDFLAACKNTLGVKISGLSNNLVMAYSSIPPESNDMPAPVTAAGTDGVTEPVLEQDSSGVVHAETVNMLPVTYVPQTVTLEVAADESITKQTAPQREGLPHPVSVGGPTQAPDTIATDIEAIDVHQTSTSQTQDRTIHDLITSTINKQEPSEASKYITTVPGPDLSNNSFNRDGAYAGIEGLVSRIMSLMTDPNAAPISAADLTTVATMAQQSISGLSPPERAFISAVTSALNVVKLGGEGRPDGPRGTGTGGLPDDLGVTSSLKRGLDEQAEALKKLHEQKTRLSTLFQPAVVVASAITRISKRVHRLINSQTGVQVMADSSSSSLWDIVTRTVVASELAQSLYDVIKSAAGLAYHKLSGSSDTMTNDLLTFLRNQEKAGGAVHSVLEALRKHAGLNVSSDLSKVLFDDAEISRFNLVYRKDLAELLETFDVSTISAEEQAFVSNLKSQLADINTPMKLKQYVDHINVSAKNSALSERMRLFMQEMQKHNQIKDPTLLGMLAKAALPGATKQAVGETAESLDATTRADVTRKSETAFALKPLGPMFEGSLAPFLDFVGDEILDRPAEEIRRQRDDFVLFDFQPDIVDYTNELEQMNVRDEAFRFTDPLEDMPVKTGDGRFGSLIDEGGREFGILGQKPDMALINDVAAARNMTPRSVKTAQTRFKIDPHYALNASSLGARSQLDPLGLTSNPLVSDLQPALQTSEAHPMTPAFDVSDYDYLFPIQPGYSNDFHGSELLVPPLLVRTRRTEDWRPYHTGTGHKFTV